MATANPFDLLGDSENDDISVLLAAQQHKIAANKPVAKAAAATPPAAAKLPSKPLPPAQAVRESRSSAAPARDGAGRGGPGRGRGGRGAGIGQVRDFGEGNNSRYGGEGGRGGGFRGGAIPEDGDAGKTTEKGGYAQPRGPFRGGHRGGFAYGNAEVGFDSDRPQRRTYERRSGTGRGYEMKREGAGRGNWGTVTDEVLAQETEESLNIDEKPVASEKKVSQEVTGTDISKDKEEPANETKEKEPEDNEMTLEEYEKIREEKRKALLAMKVEERKVEVDKDLQAMQQLAIKKGDDDVFIKLGSDRDSSKRKDNIDKDDRSKKAISINDFLKPAEGGRYYSPGGRGRGRGRGDRGPIRIGYDGGIPSSPTAPAIEDECQFPTLGGK
ncbi:hypothetical protein HPP92_003948 [Vanilla planifolia]|uniref:Hyaluronan/mRNA-binding protein domain-containing protein n=1 Tax=Vanilla planifolia TaxID=51239 RepID=A0A835S854_VANPL|nr:hypothetical protein HPP92_003948 [Vanilla planifolia]